MKNDKCDNSIIFVTGSGIEIDDYKLFRKCEMIDLGRDNCKWVRLEDMNIGRFNHLSCTF